MHDVVDRNAGLALRPKFLAPDGGLRLQSGPGRDLVFKLTGDDTGGLFDYLPERFRRKVARRLNFQGPLR
jgi:hypothetical protein